MNLAMRTLAATRGRRPAFRYRPQLEALESRLVPDGVPFSLVLLTAPLSAVPGDRTALAASATLAFADASSAAAQTPSSQIQVLFGADAVAVQGTFTTRLLPVSATYILPLLSTATLVGLSNPVPMFMQSLGVAQVGSEAGIFVTRLSSKFEKYTLPAASTATP